MPISNAALAQQISDLLGYWQTRDTEYAAWLAGVVNGGAYSNGTYPLTDYLGNTQYIKCPAQLVEDVDGVVDSASTHATAASASATAAAASATSASSSAASALAYKGDAETAATAADTSADAAAADAANASTSATNAASSETNAQTYHDNILALWGLASSSYIDGGSITDLTVTSTIDGGSLV